MRLSNDRRGHYTALELDAVRAIGRKASRNA
jgi:hypothetical protein